MSKSTVEVGAAQAAAVRDILGASSQDGRISKDHKKLIHEVRDFIRNNAAPERSSEYKAWEDSDILEVLQERAEPRMNAIAAALHILECTYSHSHMLYLRFLCRDAAGSNVLLAALFSPSLSTVHLPLSSVQYSSAIFQILSMSPEQLYSPGEPRLSCCLYRFLCFS
jgi:hypothetical protein